ncbi:three-helix bundle dimerization domain-containing protein [Streptomyces sp. NPDC002120]|uniref:three-helix bundle dimerization domain-containing protein n=1 Tax=Streptomyces sp. NPDC002120 TaxID=3364631 RepID=UPI0036756E24
MAPVSLPSTERAGTSQVLEGCGARAADGPAPTPAPAPAPEELTAVRNTVARMQAAFPLVDAAVVEATVRAAYEDFRQARVRAYIPILAERRSRRTLGAVCRTVSGPESG